MRKLIGILALPVLMAISTHSMAYFLDVNGTHYDVTWVNASYNEIIADNPSAFTKNVWWEDLYLAFTFADNWSRYGIEIMDSPGLLEFAWNVYELRGIGDYCSAIDCVVTVALTYGYDLNELTVTENYADVNWTYAFATVVPEPGALSILMIGLAGLFVTRKARE